MNYWLNSILGNFRGLINGVRENVPGVRIPPRPLFLELLRFEFSFDQILPFLDQAL